MFRARCTTNQVCQVLGHIWTACPESSPLRQEDLHFSVRFDDLRVHEHLFVRKPQTQ